MIVCPVCGEILEEPGFPELSEHFILKTNSSDPLHVMWLNRNISMRKTDSKRLSDLLEKFYDCSEKGLMYWIRRRFVAQFFSENPNPFVSEMQNPTKYTIMGYVTEHYSFLKQWVKSCSFIIAKSDIFEIQKYEVDNITEEYFGIDSRQSHVELLLKMGESVGLPRDKVTSSKPLPKTEAALNFWEHTARDGHWLNAMASMHSLELIADKNVKDYGAKYTYFNPKVLDDGLTEEVRQFLRAGYDADQYHSSNALRLIEKYAKELGMVRDVQSYFLMSSDYFYKYLEARVERGRMYEKEL